MKQKLDIKRIFRVALVDKGDNPEAEVVIHKRADEVNKMTCANCQKKGQPDANGMCPECGKPMMQKALNFRDMLTEKDLMGDFYGMTDILASAIYNCMSDDAVTDKAKAIRDNVDQFAEALKGKLGMAKNEKVETLKQKIMKALGFADGETPEPVDEPNKETTVDKNKEAPVVDEVTKAQLTELEKKAADLEKRAADAEANFAKLQEQTEVEKFAKQVEVEFVGVPGITREFGATLRKISKAVTPDELGVLVSALKGAAEVIRQSEHFKEIGKSAAEPTGAEAKLEAAVKAEMDASKLDHAAAYAKVMKEQPDLYQQYRAEQAGQNA